MKQIISRRLFLCLLTLTFILLNPTALKAQKGAKKTPGEQSESIVAMYANDVSLTAQQRQAIKSLAMGYVSFKDSVNLKHQLSLSERFNLRRDAFAKMDTSIVNILTQTQKQAIQSKRSERSALLNTTKN